MITKPKQCHAPQASPNWNVVTMRVNIIYYLLYRSLPLLIPWPGCNLLGPSPESKQAKLIDVRWVITGHHHHHHNHQHPRHRHHHRIIIIIIFIFTWLFYCSAVISKRSADVTNLLGDCPFMRKRAVCFPSYHNPLAFSFVEEDLSC